MNIYKNSFKTLLFLCAFLFIFSFTPKNALATPAVINPYHTDATNWQIKMAYYDASNTPLYGPIYTYMPYGWLISRTPVAGDYVIWHTACVDPNQPVNANYTFTDIDGTTYPTTFDAGCHYGLTNQMYAGCYGLSSSTNYGDIKANDQCPGTIYCAAGGRVNLTACNAGTCGTGANACTAYSCSRTTCNSTANSSSCGSSCTCVAGTGTTNASCGGNETACQCNGPTCQTQGYYCSAGSCVQGWAGGTTCAQSSCNGGAGCGPTPTPTPGGTCTPGTGSSTSSCGGHAYYACTSTNPAPNGTCCDFTYRCSGSSCIAACHVGVSVSFCPGGTCGITPTPTPGTNVQCQQCLNGACSSYLAPSCNGTNCNNCSGSVSC